jgi:hypothetical protein
MSFNRKNTPDDPLSIDNNLDFQKSMLCKIDDLREKSQAYSIDIINKNKIMGSNDNKLKNQMYEISNIDNNTVNETSKEGADLSSSAKSPYKDDLTDYDWTTNTLGELSNGMYYTGNILSIIAVITFLSISAYVTIKVSYHLYTFFKSGGGLSDLYDPKIIYNSLIEPVKNGISDMNSNIYEHMATGLWNEIKDIFVKFIIKPFEDAMAFILIPIKLIVGKVKDIISAVTGWKSEDVINNLKTKSIPDIFKAVYDNIYDEIYESTIKPIMDASKAATETIETASVAANAIYDAGSSIF